MPTANETIAFLAQVQTALKSKNYQILEHRHKYMATLSQLGIVKQDVIDDISNLAVGEHWKKKPDNNPSYPGDVWECKKNLHGACIYIKLKIKPASNGFLLIMSYHIDGM